MGISESAVAYNKGISLYDQRKLNEAIECFDEAIKLDPKNVDAWNNKGYTLIKQDKLKESIECFDEVIKLNPKHIFALNNKALTLDIIGNFDEAEKYYLIANEMNQHTTEEWVNIILNDNKIEKGKIFLSKYNKNTKTGRFTSFEEINSPSPLAQHILLGKNEKMLTFEDSLKLALENSQKALELILNTCVPYGKEKYSYQKKSLKEEEFLSIYIYTCELKDNSLYKIINKDLTNSDRKVMAKWKYFLFYIFNGIKKIPKENNKTVYRGVSRNLVLEFPEKYKEGNEITWFTFTSTTTTLSAIQSFIPPDKPCTIFTIESFSGRFIKSVSAIESEDEVLLPPTSRFKIISILKLSDTTMIQLKQIPSLEKLGLE